MMGAVLEWLAAALAAAVVGVILLASVVGWGARVSCWQKRGLLIMAAGVVVGAYDRLLGHPVGFGDVALFGGALVYLIARHGKHILRRADQMDGTEDGRVTFKRR